MKTYGQEQENLESEIVKLQPTVDRYDSGGSRAANFIKLIERYTDFKEITVTMLHECIEKIVVHERDRKGAIDSPQTIEIHFNFIGEFIPPTMKPKNPTPEEIAEHKKMLERRAQFRRAYEQRVASGAQKKYYERTKYKKRAERKAIKENLFDENYMLGTDVLTAATASNQ